MKTSVILASLVLAAVCCGCASTTTWETVDDEIVAASGPAEEPYIITFGVPEDVNLEPLSEGSRNLYVQKDGDYEILSDVVTAPNADEAICQVSGFDAEDLDVMETTRFGLPEYRFAWVSESDEGSYVSQAAVVEDGSYYYVLVFSAREEAGNTYDSCAESVFASFGIYGNEML